MSSHCAYVKTITSHSLSSASLSSQIQSLSSSPSSSPSSSSRLLSLNSRLLLAERGFIDPQGLSEKDAWYRHLVRGGGGIEGESEGDGSTSMDHC